MAEKVVQYPYAIDETDKLVFIEDVDRDTRREHLYRCPNCGQKMEPRQGEYNAWHFAHDHHKCGLESYIHKTAKHILAQRFNEGGAPLSIKLSNDKCRKADECKDYDQFLCKCSPYAPKLFVYKEYCLTDHYKVALEEVTIKNDDGSSFRPDVVLKSDEPAWKYIFIEICYKHKSSERKINSGNPIIEIDIDDIYRLTWLAEEKCFTDRSHCVHLYGFKTIKGVEPTVLIDAIKQQYAEEPEFHISDESLPMCGRSAAFFRSQQNLRRITLYKSGKMFENGIYENEVGRHHPAAVMDITYDSSKLTSYFDPLSLFAKKDEHYRSCRCCNHCVTSGLTDSTYCDLGKNGTTWKGTFNEQRSKYCSFFEWRHPNPVFDPTPVKELVEGVDYQIWVKPAK